MPERREVERALKASSLPAPSRLIVFTLLTHSSKGTLVVPAEYAPSLSSLADETGLGRRTVADHLKLLEGDGWLVRSRPTVEKARVEKARTGYEITIPEAVRASAAPALAQEEDLVGAGATNALVRDPHQPASARPALASATAALADEDALFGTSAGAALVREPHSVFKDSSSPTEKKTEGGVGGDGSRRKPERPIPENFTLTPLMATWASNNQRKITVDLKSETAKFINWAQANDARQRDWIARWRNWILTAQDFADKPSRASPNGRPANGSKFAPGSGPIPPPRGSTHSDDPEDW